MELMVVSSPSRWSQFRDLVDQKKDSLNSALGVQNYHLECNETKSWIKEKTKVLKLLHHSSGFSSFSP